MKTRWIYNKVQTIVAESNAVWDWPDVRDLCDQITGGEIGPRTLDRLADGATNRLQKHHPNLIDLDR